MITPGHALAAIATTLENDLTLAQTIATIERDVAHALGAAYVSIAYGRSARNDASGGHDLTLPLILDGRTIGFATFGFLRAPTSEEREILRTLTATIAVTLAWRGRMNERDRMQQLLRTDALTGLANRMAFDEHLDAAWRRGFDRSEIFTVALLDIDYFKIYNDMYGHVAGDDCLRAVGAILAEAAAREGGFVARYGGEEFAFIAERMDSAQAIAVMGRLARAFEETSLPHRGSTLGRISLCIGVAAGAPSQTNTIADFVREADRSLYRAKALGRNRICAGSYASNGVIASRNARSLAGPPVFEDATVGREADLSRILAAMRQARMISLVGRAGVGKSRLAALVGGAAQHTVSDGVAYADFSMFSPDSDPAGLIGTALDLIVDSDDARAELCDAVRERDTLLILDNVAEGAARRVAALCVELLSASPSLSILTTSRAALGCAQERAVVVTPLAEDAAMELLRVRSGTKEIAALRLIARELEGIPGAIELASRTLVSAPTIAASAG